MKKIIISALGVVLAALLIFVGKIYHQAGQFKSLHYHSSLQCRKIPGTPGAEDIDIVGNTAFISSDDRRKKGSKDYPNGTIFYLSLDKPDSKPAPAHGTLPFGFHPHGISIYQDKEGQTTLMAINHSRGHSIEIFDLRGQTLLHRKTVLSPKLISPNDIAAAGHNSFYFTNDHGTKDDGEKFKDDFLMRARGSVVYYNGTTFSYAAQKLHYPNSLFLMRPDRLFLTTTTGREFIEYSRDPETGILTEQSRSFLGTGLDNLHIDRKGRILIASHPKLLTFTSHARDKSIISPSQILIMHQKGKVWENEEIYLNDGSELSGSSVAAGYKDQILMGSVFQPHMLRCRFRK